MATINICDNCKKKNDGESDWGRLSLDNAQYIKGLEKKMWHNFIFCSECTKKIFPKIVKILNLNQKIK